MFLAGIIGVAILAFYPVRVEQERLPAEIGWIEVEWQYKKLISYASFDDYLIQNTEVTWWQYAELMGDDYWNSCQRCPATVSWYMAAAYCNGLSKKYGLQSCYECQADESIESPGCGRLDNAVACVPSPSFARPQECPGYRLPTEHEWGHAARAGTSRRWYGPVKKTAWYRSNSGGRPHEVGTLRPNAWGLFDVLGNVSEWCHEQYHRSHPDSTLYRVHRGGNYQSYCITGGSDPSCLSLKTRRAGRPNRCDAGFRPVKTIPE